MDNGEDTETSSGTNDNPGSPDQTCVICKTSEGELLKLFTDKTWASFQKAAECRLLLSSDKYRDITTDVNLKDAHGTTMYHTRCLKNFTAVKRPFSGPLYGEPPAKIPETRRRSLLPTTDEKGLLKGSCIFCPLLRKRVGGKVETLSYCLTKDGCDSIFAAASRSNNDRIKSLVHSEVDLIAKEAQYHKSCRRVYFKEADGVLPKVSQVSNRQVHTDTFDTIVALIETEVIGSHKAMLTSSLFDLYRAEYLTHIEGNIEDIDSYTVQAMTKKIENKFGEKICISLFNKRQGNFVYNAAMSLVDAKSSFHDDEKKSKLQDMIRTTALHLRTLIQGNSTKRSTTP